MEKAYTQNAVFADLKALLNIREKVHTFQFNVTNHLTNMGFGEMKSPFKTKGLDFQEVRSYQPGDDIRQIDWRITAKYDRPFTKLYTDEKARQVFLLCDMRTRMKFASRGYFKSVLVAQAAAFLAFISENKNDRLGFTLMQSELIENSQALHGHEAVISLLRLLSTSSDPKQTKEDKIALTEGLFQVEQAVRNGSLIFIISDFSDLDQNGIEIIQRLSLKNTCTLIHVYDELEATLPTGCFPVTNGKNTCFLSTTSTSFRHNYQSEFRHLKNKLLQLVQIHRLGYLSINTQTSVLEKLQIYCLEGFFL